ncbi:MAG: hypothetical protein JXA92_05860 [candidate division Zixibacteria bacterium]|nr:hypothetical protein [candidate division Zixibacteria bacterium]
MNIDKFKQCPSCKKWLSSDEVLTDPDIKPLGMAYLEDENNTAYYYFQHTVPNCGSSFLIEIKDFKPFLTEDIPQVSLMASKHCEGHCVDLYDLNVCKNECYYAPFRRLILKLTQLKKAVKVF